MKKVASPLALFTGLALITGFISSCCCCIPPNAKPDLSIGPEFPAVLTLTNPDNYPIQVPVINTLYTSVEKCDNRRTESSREDTLWYSIRTRDNPQSLDSGWTLLPRIDPEEVYKAPFVLSTSLIPAGQYSLDFRIGGAFVRDRDTTNNRTSVLLVRE